MNEIVNKFLLVGDKFMPEMTGFTYSACGVVHLPKTKKELKSLCRQDTQILFTKMSLIRLVFSMIWLMTNQNI